MRNAVKASAMHPGKGSTPRNESQRPLAIGRRSDGSAASLLTKRLTRPNGRIRNACGPCAVRQVISAERNSWSQPYGVTTIAVIADSGMRWYQNLPITSSSPSSATRVPCQSNACCGS